MITQKTGTKTSTKNQYNLTTNQQKRDKNMKSMEEIYKLQLDTAEQCITHYKRMAQDQQKRIDMLITRLNEIILLSQEAIDNHY